jgi:hypothetical protein
MMHRVQLIFLCLISLSSSLQAQQLFGSYVYEEDKITLNLSPPNNYTLFQMEQDRRTGAVTSKEISRGTFEVSGKKVVLEEFPTRQQMQLQMDTELVLQAEDVKEIENGEELYAWSMQYESGQPRMEGSWKKGKKHGTWIYYNEDGDVVKSEKYRRGKRID